MTPTFDHPETARRAQPTSLPESRRGDACIESGQDLLALLGAPAIDAVRPAAIGVALRRLPPRAALFHEGCVADAIYIVRTGTFKCFRTDADGDEQVLGFARRGDVLGYGAVGIGRHTSAASALEASCVGVVPLAEWFDWLQRVPALDRALHQALSMQQANFEELAGVRAAVPAETRLARFLLHWSRRMAVSGHSLLQLKLLASRRDIGRLLGIAHETVSRAFASLVLRGCIAVKGRTVDILDPAALAAAARARSGIARSAPGESRAAPATHESPAA